MIGILPTVVLYKAFQWFTEDEPRKNKLFDKDMHSVSQHFRAMGSTPPTKPVVVSMTSQSLSNLEKLCGHPDFSKLITQVTIDTSYFDRNMATDHRKYARHCSSELAMSGDIEERCAVGRAISRGEPCPGVPDRATRYFNMSDELKMIDTPEFQVSSATKYQRYLLRMHEHYVECSNDQEEVRSDNNHVSRICTCLSSLPALQKLRFSDKGGDDHIPTGNLPISEMYGIGMSKSGWRGFFRTAYTTEPPVEMLGELMSQLGKAGVRPEQIDIDHDVPMDARCLQVSVEQSEGIRDLVSQCSDVSINLSGMRRQHNPDESDYEVAAQSREEMLAIGSLSKALASAKGLKSLSLWLGDYPACYEHPPVNLSDLLPMRDLTWLEMERVSFNYLPFDIDEMAAFVLSHRNSVKDFTANAMYLRDGDWDQALDILRRFNFLESVELMYAHGGRYKEFDSPNFPQEEAEQYVRKLTSQNPLRVSPSSVVKTSQDRRRDG